MRAAASKAEGRDALAPKLAKLGIRTKRDLVLHLPMRYEDETKLTPLSQARAGIPVLVEADVVQDGKVEYRGRRTLVVKLSDAKLYDCPFLIASDVGTIGIKDEEAGPLREYLLKGGFLWVDDFWGTEAWNQWEQEIAKVLPPEQYPIEDISAADPIMREMFDLEKIPQITNVTFWLKNNGKTSERGEDSVQVHLRAIRDQHRRNANSSLAQPPQRFVSLRHIDDM